MPSCRVCLSLCVSVCLSRSWVVSKRINISSKFFSPSIHPASHRVTTPFYTVSQKNVPALESCSFDKHGLILIIFDTQHQHTFENDTDFNFPCPFTFTYFICFLVAATEMTRSDVPLCSWTVQKYRTLSLQICIRQTVWLTNTEFVDWCRNVCTLYNHLFAIPAAVTSLKQRLINTWASISQNVINEAVRQWTKRLRASMRKTDITLNIC